MMKYSSLTYLILCFLCSVSQARISYGQKVLDSTVTVKFTDLPLPEALDRIARQVAVKFAYSDYIPNHSEPVTLRAENEKLADVLEQILSPRNLTYTLIDNTVVLKRAAPVHSPASIYSPPPRVKPQFLSLKSSIPLSMQQITVSGKVTDKAGQPLPGASILVKGTLTGTATDEEGVYDLENVAGDDVLIFSLIGYLSQEIPVSGQKTINVTLEQDVASLEEVVVIGYGTQKKKDVTGAISTISEMAIKEMPAGSIDEALIGRIPGLDIVSSGNNPGDGTEIRLRGRRSFNASNDPLVILDGIPFYGNISDINPYDIKSVDVLKDASSTAIYGSRGANGVIIITTKRGVIGKPQFTVESFGGPVIRYGRVPYGNGEQYAERGREALRATGVYPENGIDDELDRQLFYAEEYESLQKDEWVDYQDLLLQNGYRQKHQVNVLGGSEAVKYSISGNVYDEEGILPEQKFDRYSVRSNLDITLSPKFSSGASILLSYSKWQRRSGTDALRQAYRNSPLGIPYEDDGTPRFKPTPDGSLVLPVADYEFDSYRYANKRWTAYISAYGEYKITGSLSYRINLGADVNLNTIKESAGSLSLMRREGSPIANINNSVFSRKLYESVLTFDKSFNEDHHLTLTAVHGIQTSHGETSGLDVSELPYEMARYNNVGAATVINGVLSDLTDWTLLSYVGRLFYGYRSKYLLTASMRADGASVFAPNHKWGYFPSLAVAWRISEEPFMDNLDWMSDLKLRLSYGVTGNQAINPYQTQGGLSLTTYAWNESPAFGYSQSDLANKDLKWESTKVYNIGVDFGVLSGRLSGSLELYRTRTYDLLMDRQLPITSGYDQVIENVGKTANRGIELGLSSINIDKKAFKWSSDLSFYLNREEIVELYNGKVDDIGNRWFIGEPIHVYYDFKKIGIWQTGEAAEAQEYARKPGQIKLLDVNEDGQYSDADRILIGNRVPKWVGSIANRFTYKNFDLSFMVYARWGGTTRVDAFSPSSQKRYNVLAVDYWTPDNPTNNYPRPDENYGGTLDGSSLMYRDGSFIRLRQLSIGYRVPAPLLGKLSAGSAKVYITGENLWYWTRSEMRRFNMEPESNMDIDTVNPALRTIVLGLNITF